MWFPSWKIYSVVLHFSFYPFCIYATFSFSKKKRFLKTFQQHSPFFSVIFGLTIVRPQRMEAELRLLDDSLPLLSILVKEGAVYVTKQRKSQEISFFTLIVPVYSKTNLFLQLSIDKKTCAFISLIPKFSTINYACIVIIHNWKKKYLLILY